MTTNDLLSVKLGGQQLDGWTGYRITRGIEKLPSAMVLEFTERYPGLASQVVIAPGQAFTASLGSDLVLTGYADLDWPHQDANRHIVRSELRSKICDLVDCSLAPKLGTDVMQWVYQGGTIGAIATQLCQPFGIAVTGDGVSAPLDPKVPFVVNPGETVAELLEQMARIARVMMWDDEQGRLVFSHVGMTRAGNGLVEGVNCEVEEARLSMDQRFSDIYVVAQTPEKTSGHVTIWGQQQDPGVPRYRPKLIAMDGVSIDASYAMDRAKWEVARRIGRSTIADVTVTGHRDVAGNLWRANTLVGCNLPSLKINRDMLIAEVAYLGSEAGTSTLLTAMPPEGFQPEPLFIPNPFADDQAPGPAGNSQGAI